jgi:hypothetical protein
MILRFEEVREFDIHKIVWDYDEQVDWLTVRVFGPHDEDCKRSLYANYQSDFVRLTECGLFAGRRQATIVRLQAFIARMQRSDGPVFRKLVIRLEQCLDEILSEDY